MKLIAILLLLLVFLLEATSKEEEKFTHVKNSTLICAEASEMQILAIQCPVFFAVQGCAFASFGNPIGSCGEYEKVSVLSHHNIS